MNAFLAKLPFLVRLAIAIALADLVGRGLVAGLADVDSGMWRDVPASSTSQTAMLG